MFVIENITKCTLYCFIYTYRKFQINVQIFPSNECALFHKMEILYHSEWACNRALAVIKGLCNL